MVGVAVCVVTAVGCTASRDEQVTASLQSEVRVTVPEEDPFGDLDLGDEDIADDLVAGMEDALGGVFGGTTSPTMPRGSATPSDADAERLRGAVATTLAEASVSAVVRQDSMGMDPEITSISSISGDRSESVMGMGLGLSVIYRYVDGTVYVRQEGPVDDALGVDLDKWVPQPGDPTLLRNQVEAMTGVGVLRQLSGATDVGPADPSRAPAAWDVDEVLAFALVSQDLMGGEARSSGTVGLRDGRVVEVELVGDTQLYIAGRSSDQWLPFEASISFLEFGVPLDGVIVPPPEQMAD